MNKRFLLVVLLTGLGLCFTALCLGVSFLLAGKTLIITGTGETTTEEREITDFTKIEVAGAIDVIVSKGTTNSVKVQADKQFIAGIVTRVEDGKLIVKQEQEFFLRLGTVANPKVTIVMKNEPEAITLAGSGETLLDRLISEDLELSVVASGDVTMEYCSFAKLVANIAGSGSIEASGDAEYFTLSIAASGSFEGGNFLTRVAEVNIVGSGSAVINVRDELDASIVGSGDIAYSGNPTVTKNILGSGDITQVEN